MSTTPVYTRMYGVTVTVKAASVGKRIREARLGAQMSQTDLARAISVSDHTVSRYEQGHITPSADALLRLSKALSVSTDWLLTGRAATATG